MAKDLRRLTSGIIVVLMVLCALAIYANHLSSIQASDRETLKTRAGLVRRYLELVTRDVRDVADEISNWYVVSSPDARPLGSLAAPQVGTFIQLGNHGKPTAELHREVQAVARLEDRFRFLTHAASDFGRIYYQSALGPVYVTPAIPRGLENAFLEFANSATRSSKRLHWLLRRADMFDLGDAQTTLWIAAPVKATGGILSIRIKSDKIRPMLRQADSVSNFYLTDENEPVRLWSNRAKRFSVAQGTGDLSAGPAPDGPDSHIVGNGLRIVQRYAAGEPYLAAARASLVPWLILAAAAGMTGWLVHRALRTEIAERRRAESDVRNAYDAQQKLSARLRSLAYELTMVQHRERKRLARLLHDDLQQSLAATQMKLHQVKRKGVGIEDAEGLLAEAIDTSRNLARDLRPAALYDEGIIPALRWFAEQTRKRYSLELIIDATEDDTCEQLSEEVKGLLFEAARELVFNVVKHADASRASIKLRVMYEHIQISVRDWGKGFDMNTRSSSAGFGFGLFSVEERLVAIGGEMSIDSAVGRGTAVHMVVPLHRGPQEVEETGTIRANGAPGNH